MDEDNESKKVEVIHRYSIAGVIVPIVIIILLVFGGIFLYNRHKQSQQDACVRRLATKIGALSTDDATKSNLLETGLSGCKGSSPSTFDPSFSQ